MKALLYSDWCVIKSSIKSYIVPGLATMAIAIMTGVDGIEPSTMALAAHIHSVAVSTGMIMLSLFGIFGFFGNDEREGWEGMRLSLPVSRRTVVRSRYVSMLAWMGAIMVVVNLLGMLVGAIVSGIRYGQPGFIPAGELALANGIIAMGTMLYAAIVTPVFFKMGISKARVYVSLPFLACMLIPLLPGQEAFQAHASHVVQLIDAMRSPLPLVAVALVVGLTCYGASSLLSERIYARRSF